MADIFIEINPLYRYLCGVFGMEGTARLFNLYRIGTSAKWGGSTVFWQTDDAGRTRTGKVMLYNLATGRRVKEPQVYVSWAHAELRLPDFNLRQCLFGQHLFPLYPDKTVFLIESEKSAVIASHYMPDVSGSLREARISALIARPSRRCADAMSCCCPTSEQPMNGGRSCRSSSPSVRASLSVRCSKIWLTMNNAIRVLISPDFLLATPTRRQILCRMIERNPSLRQLIDELDLELVEA